LTSVALLEERVIRYLREIHEPVPQFSLAKELKLNSRLISRILARLEKKGVIKRERAIINGRRTFLVYPLETFLLRDLPTAPCFYCPYLEYCGRGHEYDPTKCDKLAKWLSGED